LLNEENPRGSLEETHPAVGPEKEITHDEVDTTIKR